MVTLGMLEEIQDIRTIWQNEAKDFTAWLAKDENLKLLSASIGIEIAVDEIDSPVGNFRVDILASESGTNRKIIIGTQLEETSSEYLGNLVTYAAGKNADLIIWLVRHAREEHKAAIEWLNSHTEDKTGIFLCEVKLYTIGSSNPAVKFEAVVKPNNWAKEVRKISEGTSSIERLRYEYWGMFQDYAFGEEARNKKFAGSYKRWRNSSHYGVVFGIGKPGCNIQVTRMKNDIETGLYIADDKKLFSYLLGRKDEIEAECGLKFEWGELSDNKASRISIKKTSAGLENKENWPEQFEWIIDTVLREKETFSKFIKEAAI